MLLDTVIILFDLPSRVLQVGLVYLLNTGNGSVCKMYRTFINGSQNKYKCLSGSTALMVISAKPLLKLIKKMLNADLKTDKTFFKLVVKQ